MIEMELPSKKFFKMVSQALVNNKGIDSISALITPDGIIFSDISSGYLGSYCVFKPGFFKRYEVDEVKEVNLNKSVIDELKKLKFKSKHDITYSVDKENSIFESHGRKLESYIPAFKELGTNGLSADRFMFALAEQIGIGILPTDPRRPILAQFEINPKDLSEFRRIQSEKIIFVIDDEENIKQKCNFCGAFSNTITPIQTNVMAPLEQGIQYFSLKRILDNFDKSVWVTIYEIFHFYTIVNENYSLMYLLAVDNLNHKEE